MTLTEIICRPLMPEGVTPVYNSLLGLFFRHEDGIRWDTYEACLQVCAAIGTGDKEWFL